MLDAAEPGQTRPTRHDVIDIVGGGVRRRLRLARRFGSMVACVLAAIAVACTTAAAAGLLVITYLAPIPTEAEAMAAARIATGIDPHNVPGPMLRCDYWCPDDWHTSGDQVASFDGQIDRNVGLKDGIDGLHAVGHVPLDDHVGIVLSVRSLEPTVVAAQAHARLVAADWRVSPSARNSTRAASGRPMATSCCTTRPASRVAPPLPLSASAGPTHTSAAVADRGRAPGRASRRVGSRRLGRPRRVRRHHPTVRALVTIAGLQVLLVIAVAESGIVMTVLFAISNSAPSMLSPAVVLSFLGEVPLVAPLTAAATIGILALTALPVRPSNRTDVLTPH